MNRPPFHPRKILLVGESQRETALSLLHNLPVDAEKPLEVVFREEAKIRRPDANARMWAGPLRDISQQGFIRGKQYSAECWHEYFKREYLPEEFDPESCNEGYVKWDYTPAGDRVLVGSTTQLTVKGFAVYMMQVEAFGASIGVMFSEITRREE
jgi:hypothetical protein